MFHGILNYREVAFKVIRFFSCQGNWVESTLLDSFDNMLHMHLFFLTMIGFQIRYNYSAILVIKRPYQNICLFARRKPYSPTSYKEIVILSYIFDFCVGYKTWAI